MKLKPHKVVGILTLAVSGLLKSRDKKPFGCGPCGEVQIYYMGEGGGFPQVRVVVGFVNPKLPVGCPNTKGVLTLQIRVSE
jgi:hypothetical protein